MAVVFIGLSLPGVQAIPGELAAGRRLILVVLLFPLAGLWLAWLGWRNWRNLRVYGRALLFPDPLPGQAGGDVGGRITLARRLSGDGWLVTLQCLRGRITSGRRLRLAEGIAGRPVAEALRDNLVTLLRLR
jgi:hypothetical protein